VTPTLAVIRAGLDRRFANAFEPGGDRGDRGYRRWMMTRLIGPLAAS
jgi:hypothetical protein